MGAASVECRFTTRVQRDCGRGGSARRTGRNGERHCAAPEATCSTGQEGQPESEILSLLRNEDDGQELPYMQLGDLLVKDENSLVFAVLSASCELQFVPTHIHKDRERFRDDTVLLVPGRLRTWEPRRQRNHRQRLGSLNGTGSRIASTGLTASSLASRTVRSGSCYRSGATCITGDFKPHAPSNCSKRCCRSCRESDWRSGRRFLATSRSPSTGGRRISHLGNWAKPVVQGALLFHGRQADQRVLVLRKSAFFHFAGEMKKHADDVTSAAGVDAKLKAKLGRRQRRRSWPQWEV